MKRFICCAVALVMALIPLSSFAEYTQLEKGAKGESVSALQARLKELGFYSIAVDGDYGNGTMNAVKAFEEYNGLTPTGVASIEVQELLFSEAAKGIPTANVDIADVGLKQTYGQYYAYPIIANNTNDDIDAVTVRVKWYNSYGERMLNDPIKLSDAIYDFYNPETGIYYDWSTMDINNINIPAYESYKVKGDNELPMEVSVPHNSISVIKMAVIRYHTVDGRTVNIPENEQFWRGSDGSIECLEYENNLYELPELTDEMSAKASSFRIGMNTYPVGNFVAKDLGLPMGGAYVASVDADSMAERAGIRAGDVIVKIGTVYVMSIGDNFDVAKALMSETEPSDVLFYRNGEEKHTEFTIQ